MSWSVFFIGTPDNIEKAIEKHSEQLIGDSKKEFDSLKPALSALVRANYNADGAPALKLSANGHAYVANGQPKFSTCNVSLENMGSALV